MIVQEDSRNLISHYARGVAAADNLKDVSVCLDRLMALVPVLVLEA